MITDIDECMERLRENVEASLPPTADLIAEAAAEPAETICAKGDATASGGAVEGGWDGRTAVRTCEMDWRQGADHLQPPYEVVLVADVASLSCSKLLNARKAPALRTASHAQQLWPSQPGPADQRHGVMHNVTIPSTL